MKYIIFWSGVRDKGKKQVEDFKWLKWDKENGKEDKCAWQKLVTKNIFLIWKKVTNLW